MLAAGVEYTSVLESDQGMVRTGILVPMAKEGHDGVLLRLTSPELGGVPVPLEPPKVIGLPSDEARAILSGRLGFPGPASTMGAFTAERVVS